MDYRSKTFGCSRCGSEAYLTVTEPSKEAGWSSARQGGESINTMLSAAGKPSEGIFASIIGTVALIFAAVGVVVQLKEALNVV